MKTGPTSPWLLVPRFKLFLKVTLLVGWLSIQIHAGDDLNCDSISHVYMRFSYGKPHWLLHFFNNFSSFYELEDQNIQILLCSNFFLKFLLVIIS